VRSVSFVTDRAAPRTIVVDVEGVRVSLSANRLSDLCRTALLEEVDRAVGRDHIVKKVLLLFRAWIAAGGGSAGAAAAAAAAAALGGAGGAASAASSAPLPPLVLTPVAALPWPAALSCVLWLFVRRAPILTSPLAAFAWLLADLAAFDWDHAALTIHGAIPIEEVAAAANLTAAASSTAPARIDALGGGSGSGARGGGGGRRRGASGAEGAAAAALSASGASAAAAPAASSLPLAPSSGAPTAGSGVSHFLPFPTPAALPPPGPLG
jgi:hypothetical protein